jgi:hypothetical protein
MPTPGSPDSAHAGPLQGAPPPSPSPQGHRKRRLLRWLLASVALNGGLALWLGYVLWERLAPAEPACRPIATLAVLPMDYKGEMDDSFRARVREFDTDLPAHLNQKLGVQALVVQPKSGQTPWQIAKDKKVDAVLAFELKSSGAYFTGVEARLVHVDTGQVVWKANIPMTDGTLDHLPGVVIKGLKPLVQAPGQ